MNSHPQICDTWKTEEAYLFSPQNMKNGVYNRLLQADLEQKWSPVLQSGLSVPFTQGPPVF